jgi:cytochrome c peroxidase
LWLPALASCTGEEPAPVGGSFTEEELSVLREKLGVLAEAPPRDPTNEVADSADAAALGQKLYFDGRYSADGTTSCATCHNPEQGFQDARANTSEGVAGFTGRHAPTVLNVAYGSGEEGATAWNFWDGRKDSQWSQALGPPENPVEMGSTRTKVAYLMHDKYKAEVEALFGAMPALYDMAQNPLYPDTAAPGTAEWDAIPPDEQGAITQVYVNFGKAIAAYERLIVSRGSAFDRFYSEIMSGQADSAALSDVEKAGLRLFIGKGACVNCHSGPNFSDWKFYNIGVAQEGTSIPAEDTGRQDGVAKVKADEFNCASRWSDHPDKAACEVQSLASKASDLGAFRVPTLRGVSQTAPYMHTGNLATLEDVVLHYSVGGAAGGFSGAIDPQIERLDLTEEEQAALVAFMRALDGEPLDPMLRSAPPLPP